VFQQDGAHTWYGKYNAQWLKTTVFLCMLCKEFGHWIPCATASVMYLKQQSSLAICCVIFQTYCVKRNQIMGTVFTNLVSL